METTNKTYEVTITQTAAGTERVTFSNGTMNGSGAPIRLVCFPDSCAASIHKDIKNAKVGDTVTVSGVLQWNEKYGGNQIVVHDKGHSIEDIEHDFDHADAEPIEPGTPKGVIQCSGGFKCTHCFVLSSPHLKLGLDDNVTYFVDEKRQYWSRTTIVKSDDGEYIEVPESF